MLAVRPSSKSAHENRFARLSVERLETRDCPASLTLNAVVVNGQYIELSGQVTDAPSGEISIHFSGAVYHSTIANPDGSFTFFGDYGTLGTVYAVAYDEQGPISDSAEDEITSEPPQIYFTGISNENGPFWTVTGYVTDEHAAGLTVRFGGPASGSTTTVNEDGTFIATFYIEQSETYATLTAMTTDWWGLDSNTAMVGMY